MFDRVPARLQPVNKQSANVIKKGEHWAPGNKINGFERNTPWSVIPEGCIGVHPYANLPNLTGIQRGRLIAYGFNEYHGRWACRCQCGQYVLRSTKAMSNDSNTADACSECRQLLFLKREDHFRRTGKDLPYEAFL